MQDIPLYTHYPDLKKIPRVEISELPTPIQKLDFCSKKFGGNIWIKCDNLSHLEYGGNKSRKYEFMFAKAIEHGKREILTIGGVGSNHTVANTVFSKKFGLKSIIYLIPQPLNEHVRENMLLDYYFGAEMHYCKGSGAVVRKILWRTLTHRKNFVILPGASVPTGTIGFVNAAFELAEQVKNGELPEPDILFVAVGSAGTCAGLTLGLELADLKTKVHGIGVSFEGFTSKKRVLSLAKKTLKKMRKYDTSLPKYGKIKKNLIERLDVSHEFYGGEYGRITEEGLRAIKIIKEDRVKLRTTYTGKAFSGLIDYCENNKEQIGDKNFNILFWNTVNSVDLTDKANQIDWHELPKPLHQYFDGTVSFDINAIKAMNIMSHERTVRLKLGDKAPLFSQESYIDKQMVDLGDILKDLKINSPNKKIVLIFGRYFGCPICQDDFDDLLENAEKIKELGGKIIYITQGSKEKTLKYVKEKNVPFPILHSYREGLYLDYGIGKLSLASIAKIPKKMVTTRLQGHSHGVYEGWEMQSPAQFIINSDGKIIHSRLDWLHLDSLLKDLEKNE